jgi:hypothetical protein
MRVCLLRTIKVKLLVVDKNMENVELAERVVILKVEGNLWIESELLIEIE